jgi:peptidoglycan hydrolase-like protein with peptidoglycan-binding domain
VTRRDLAVTEDVTGDLGYADKRELTTHRAGVVTYLPEEASTVRQGRILYGVDLEPTVLLTGTVPAFRALSTASSDGEDVRQLERALVALGYGADIKVNKDFTSATADAVEEWEEDLGREDPDGKIELGDVVFAPGPVRVASRTVSVGTQVQNATPVLSISSTAKVAEVDLDVDKSDLVAPKDVVTVRLPNGKDTQGRVASVGTDPQTNESDPDADPTVLMIVTLGKPADAADFDSGSVTVTIEQSRDEDVLAVPVTALLALAEGGYAVQVVDPARASGYRLLAVQTGTITEDFAGITGDGVREGLEVVVPA